MKILQIMATSGGMGGLEQHTFNLTNALAQHDKVTLLAQQDYASEVDEHVNFVAFDFSRSRKSLILLWQLIQQIKQIAPDIIHTQAGKASAIIDSIRPWLSRDIRYVSTVHGTKKNKHIYAQSDAIIAVSQGLTEGLPLEKTHVIYNGVLPTQTLAQEDINTLWQEIQINHPQLNVQKKTVIWVGRLEAVKHVELLIQAFQHLDANLLLIGHGSEYELRKQQVETLGLSNQVAFLGFKANARDYIQLADVVALSSHREGFPLVMVEALQAKKRFASTRVNGVVEWIPPLYLADLGDVKQLHQALHHALNDQSDLDFQPLFIHAADELTVEAMTQKTRQVYHRILK